MLSYPILYYPILWQPKTPKSLENTDFCFDVEHTWSRVRRGQEWCAGRQNTLHRGLYISTSHSLGYLRGFIFNIPTFFVFRGENNFQNLWKFCEKYDTMK